MRIKKNNYEVDTMVHNEGIQCSVTSCSNNYFTSVENSKSTCNQGAWSATLACQLSKTPCSNAPTPVSNADIKCSDKDQVAGGSTYFDGTRCQLICKSGYVIQPKSGKPEVQCINGSWKNTAHSCAKGSLKKALIYI